MLGGELFLRGLRIDVIIPFLLLVIVIALGVGSCLLDDHDFLHGTLPFLKSVEITQPNGCIINYIILYFSVSIVFTSF